MIATATCGDSHTTLKGETGRVLHLGGVVRDHKERGTRREEGIMDSI